MQAFFAFFLSFSPVNHRLSAHRVLQHKLPCGGPRRGVLLHERPRTYNGMQSFEQILKLAEVFGVVPGALFSEEGSA